MSDDYPSGWLWREFAKANRAIARWPAGMRRGYTRRELLEDAKRCDAEALRREASTTTGER